MAAINGSEASTMSVSAREADDWSDNSVESNQSEQIVGRVASDRTAQSE